jgi:hypothetical protein
MTHPPILNTDLTALKKDDVDPAVKTAARSSIWRFAWDIKGGDVIYVGDSDTHSIIARGFVTSKVGRRAYRYNADKAITEPSNPQIPWRHEVPVEWDKDFAPFPYVDPAPRYTVMPFVAPSEEGAIGQRTTQGSEADATDSPPVSDSAYMRQTHASQKNIDRLHASLSNRFRDWLEKSFAVKVVQEKRRIDLSFTCSTGTHMAELKICYGANARHAIREALGQLFEYNHYPPYEEAQRWWLVLDCQPSEADREYLAILKKKYLIPLTIAWPLDDGFDVFPSTPMKA